MTGPKKRAKGLRMNELVEATGVPKSAILYYLSRGLLPKPDKTSPNMAYYDPACIERIRCIQRLQERHRLSLTEIRHMLAGQTDPSGISLMLELNDVVFRRRPGRLFSSEEFLRQAGLTRDQLARLLEARLLQPLEKGRFDPEDVGMGRIYGRAFKAGVRVTDLAYYVEYGEKIVEQELSLRTRLTGHLPYQENAAMTIEMVKDARMCRSYVIDRLFQRRVAAMRNLKEKKKKP